MLRFFESRPHPAGGRVRLKSDKRRRLLETGVLGVLYTLSIGAGTGLTAAQGRFVFDHLETGSQFEYVVGIRYRGQLYRSAAVTLKSGQHRTEVLVEVGSASTHPRLHVTKHLMVVTLQADHLEVREVVVIRYDGKTPYTGSAAHAGHSAFSLHLPLPEGYYNLRHIQGLMAKHFRRHPSGLYYTAPLTPGEHRVVYIYALPFRRDMSVVFTDHSLPATVFDIFIDDARLVATSDLPFGGRVAAKPHDFLHFRGTNIAAHARSWLQLTRRTAPSPLLQTAAYSLAFGITLLGIALPGYGIWRRRTRQTQPEVITPAELQELYAARDRLFRTIARLDIEREADRLDETEYRQQRQTCKRQLVELVEYLHRTGRTLPSASGYATAAMVIRQSRSGEADQDEGTS